jgi:hypothetical protein
METVTIGMPIESLGIKFEPDAEIGQKKIFFKGSVTDTFADQAILVNANEKHFERRLI